MLSSSNIIVAFVLFYLSAFYIAPTFCQIQSSTATNLQFGQKFSVEAFTASYNFQYIIVPFQRVLQIDLFAPQESFNFTVYYHENTEQHETATKPSPYVKPITFFYFDFVIDQTPELVVCPVFNINFRVRYNSDAQLPSNVNPKSIRYALYNEEANAYSLFPASAGFETNADTRAVSQSATGNTHVKTLTWSMALVGETKGVIGGYNSSSSISYSLAICMALIFAFLL